MLHPVDSTHPVEPTIARMTEEAAKQKALATTEKRELAGDDSYVDSSAGAKETRANALDNPLTGISLDRLEAMGRAFAREKGLGEFELEFAKGAQAAQDATVTDLPLLDEEDREVIRREVTHKWSHPKTVRSLLSRSFDLTVRRKSRT